MKQDVGADATERQDDEEEVGEAKGDHFNVKELFLKW